MLAALMLCLDVRLRPQEVPVGQEGAAGSASLGCSASSGCWASLVARLLNLRRFATHCYYGHTHGYRHCATVLLHFLLPLASSSASNVPRHPSWPKHIPRLLQRALSTTFRSSGILSLTLHLEKKSQFGREPKRGQDVSESGN